MIEESLIMDCRMRIIYPYRLNKEFNFNFPEGYWLWQTPEEGWRVQQSKYCNNNSQDKNTTWMNKAVILAYKIGIPPHRVDCYAVKSGASHIYITTEIIQY